MPSKSRDTDNMKYLGSGMFSTAYLHPNGYVYLRSICHAKEAMCMGCFPDHPLFPVIHESDVQGFEYKMQYYPRMAGLKAHLDAHEWVKYKLLKACAPCNGYSNLRKQFANLPAELQEPMLCAVDGMTMYGEDICFEISPRNVAVHEGKLVLLDCFFMKAQLIQQRKLKARRKNNATCRGMRIQP